MKQLQQGKKKLQKGFTLIELMIVVAVIGVLAAIAIPQYQDYVKKGALGSALATATSLKTNVEDYIASEGTFPDVAATSSGSSTSDDVSVPAFSLGTIALAASGADSAGNIVVELDKGPANGEKITLDRTDAGTWKCTNSAEASDGITLNGC
ncbi:pilin [Vibrio sp. CK2-1]|uniref:pilin n=1 Tax=Vibrio sp. CK2-1 TaxID=2912249 RepID=UPI001F15889D|nr:pilin [Vibrio sp. CK2-1]MCF7355138.1 pilin [Vibrio sp. CK2-1]